MSITKIIKNLYLCLFTVTPLIFSLFNSEFFEFPKMYFVYLLTISIFIFHSINSLILGKSSFLKKNFLFYAFLLFYISQVISTIFSIDIFTSFFGYYSRQNGGLLSLSTYFILFIILNNYIDKNLKQKIITFSLISASIISLYGILQHFGIDEKYWGSTVRTRIFSSFGQPNWLAAYLCLIIPFISYKININKTKKTFFYYLFICIFFISIIFTKSQSGLIATLIIISIYLLLGFKNNLKKSLIIFFLFIFLLLTINNPLKDKLIPTSKSPTKTTSSSTLNITPSGDIRKIVWNGAINLWKKYPISGTGPETFAFTYYWVRPPEHNLTSEWKYIYDKAHNEYLNYLATSGLLGFVTYTILILISLFYISKITDNKLKISIFLSYFSILITNFFGFSTVTISLFFFLLPLFSQENISDNLSIFKRSLFSKLIAIIIIIISIISIKFTFNIYFSDIYYHQATIFDKNNRFQTSFQLINKALQYFPQNPIFLSQKASTASKLIFVDKTKQSEYENIAKKNIELALQISPFNINFWKERAQIYRYLTAIKKDYYVDSIDSLYKLSILTPTDPENYYLIGTMLETVNNKQDAQNYLEKAIDLKSNYDYAHFALGKLFFDQKEYKLAKEHFLIVIQIAPNNTDAQDYLNKISKLSR